MEKQQQNEHGTSKAPTEQVISDEVVYTVLTAGSTEGETAPRHSFWCLKNTGNQKNILLCTQAIYGVGGFLYLIGNTDEDKSCL